LQADLATRAKVRVETIRRMESFPEQIGCRRTTLDKVTRALERGGIEFLNHARPGVRIKE
jgi:hypothetical protein